MARVLIIDDDPMICEALGSVVDGLGHSHLGAETLARGLNILSAGGVDVVFLDVRLPDGSGLEAITSIRNRADAPEVIIITGEGDPDGAELAVRHGAWDYVQKPASIDRMVLPLLRALEYRENNSGVRRGVDLKRDRVIGSSPATATCLEIAASAAENSASVLLTGETGVGKEVFARVIHENSDRANGPFVVVDCASLPPNLVESLLFGHVKGAFTSADRDRSGLVGQADRGTLFLDEVGEMPLEVQRVFLRVLQERRFRPVGSNQEVSSDFRLMAATNRNLDRDVAAAAFRNDLLFRLRTIVLDVPPLRERREDIRDLADHYSREICNRYGVAEKKPAQDMYEALEGYHWPGNVRELINSLERAIVAAGDGPVLYARYLPEEMRVYMARSSVERSMASIKRDDSADLGNGAPPPFEEFRNKAFTTYLTRLMASSCDSVTRACDISGLSRSYLYKLLDKYGVRKKD